MEFKVKKILKTLFFTFIILLFINTKISAASTNKTIVIVTDQLDFSTITNLQTDYKISLGLMNTRTANVFDNSKESYFMTIAAGRRVELEKGLFKGIRVDNQKNLVIEGYDQIIDQLDKNYPDFSKKMEFLADCFKKNGIKVGYIGNDISSLMAADKNGKIYYGYPSIEYEKNWMIEKTKDTFKNADLLILSYNIHQDENRVELLEEYLNEFSEYCIMMFPSNVSGDVKDIRNTTLVPFLYYNPNKIPGILSSDSTQRQGLITNMDVFPELSDIYHIEVPTDIGHKINASGNWESKENLVQKNKNLLEKTLNFIIIKYIFHGIVVIVQLYIIYDLCKKRHTYYHRYYWLLNGIIISIFLSIFLASFRLGKSILLYVSMILFLTIGIVWLMERKKVPPAIFFPLATNILLLIAVFFQPDMIYHSFYGFTNIVSGGRFYGLNNESMGILLATSIITFFWIKSKINNKLIVIGAWILYFFIIILALSDSYASNFGGYLTSIVLFFMIFYILWNEKKNRKSFFILVILGISIFIVNLLGELPNSPIGHAKGLFFRLHILGMYEFIDMIIKKVKQLLLTAISPPWSVVFAFQIYFLRDFILNGKIMIEKIKKEKPDKVLEIMMIWISAILVFVLNDTGSVAFVYMNIYSITQMIYLKELYQ
ncbi:hypothetical protein [Garciella nitratireducens]|uniref:hypothetical protein n=1 Tax=Garciella nitratireducens TaxID=218205 RepID=UPI001BD5C13E|nr:hypothetical protein [Garciella nitratireducens]